MIAPVAGEFTGPRPWRLPETVRAVIFDLDGVLLDTEPLYTKATAAVAARFGKTYDWSVKSQCIGRGAEEAARTIVESLGLPLSPRELKRERDALLLPMLADAPAMPGAEAFTRALVARGIPLAIATSSEARLFTLKAARHAAWFDVFGAVVCGDDPRVGKPKPAPDIFLVAATALGVVPAACAVVEDSPFGIAGARAAGMLTVAMPDPAMDREAYAGATAIVDGFAELAPPDAT